MKKTISLFLALFMIAVTVLPVMAASEAAAGPKAPFALVGKITAIDSAAGTITVKVYKGNRVVQPYRGQEVVLNTAAATRYLSKTSAAAVSVPITFADLMVGQAVSAQGRLADGVWTAARVTAGAKLSCFP